ncbi:MAG: hypothetical protein NTU88_05240, partial [Armatimonadetes bacterium]|nr:hypothetical protein [Armatimonadota bacterium]
ELLTVYVMVSITSGICSHNMMSILVSCMGYAHFFQTPENQWGRLFIERLPHWLIVSDTTSLRNFYYGNSTLYTWANVKPWILPGLMWSSFTAVTLFTTLCINSILRKQWIEAERLTFPIIMLPLEMTEESGSLFKNKYMWMGFAFAGGLTLFAGLNYLYPSIPCLRIQRQNIGYFIVNPPWNAIGSVQMGFYFFAIGLAFLMPLELSFSCWFFFWLARLELVFCRIVGLNELAVVGSGFDRAYPFLNSQAYGAYFGFFVMSMWASRRYLGRVFRTAFRGTKEEDESREAVSYRTAILGALAGVLLLCVFALKVGMTLWVVAVFFVLYFIHDRRNPRNAARLLDASPHVLSQRRRNRQRGAVGARTRARRVEYPGRLAEAARSAEPNRDGVRRRRIPRRRAALMAEDTVPRVSVSSAGIRARTELGSRPALDAAADREHGEVSLAQIRGTAELPPGSAVLLRAYARRNRDRKPVDDHRHRARDPDLRLLAGEVPVVRHRKHPNSARKYHTKYAGHRG